MKKLTTLLALGFMASLLSSCCLLGGCDSMSNVDQGQSGACNSIYLPSDGHCDTVGLAVLNRATGQGASGEPHLGTIPTMKVLVP